MRIRGREAHHPGVIDAAAVIPMLLKACPSFRTRWAAYVAGATYDESLLYMHLCEFAHHVVQLLKSRSTGEFAAIFDAVERLHIEGDSYVREAATIGLLEGLQNIGDHAGLDPDAFVAYLRPVSAQWWAELNGFWAGTLPYVGAGLKREP